MPRLGEFIGALLSDAVQAQVRADVEALKIAEAYSKDALLKHLPVPRFRLPDITVDLPVLVSAVEGLTEGGGGRPLVEPTKAEITAAVRNALRGSGIRLPAAEVTKVVAAATQRAKELFGSGAQMLLSPVRASGELVSVVMGAVRAATNPDTPADSIQALEVGMRESMMALLSTKLARSPSLQVMVTAGEIKSHASSDSIVRIRLTITEDAYEVIPRDDGQGFYLTPE